MEEEKQLSGLGGWLALVGLGILISPIRILILLVPTFIEVFSGDTWSILTTPGNDVYSPYWAPILLSEIAVNSAIIIAWIYIGYLFFKKKKSFPKWYIGIILFTFVYTIFDAFTIKLVLPSEPLFDPDTLKSLARLSVMAAIWIPYMLVSKRVKATFLK